MSSSSDGLGQPHPHYGHVALLADPTKLRHLISGEEVVLQDGVCKLEFTEEGMGILSDEDGTRSPLQDSLEHAVFACGDGSAKLISRCTQQVTVMEPLAFKPEHKYMELCMPEGAIRILVWKFPCMSAGAHIWWDLPSCSPIYNPLESAHLNSFINNHWPRWLAAFSVTKFPEYLGFRKPLDRSGRKSSWHRCLREPSASTCGILSLLCYRGCTAQLRDGARAAVRQALAALLAATVGQEAFEITCALDPGERLFLGLPAAGAPQATVLVEECAVWVEPLVSQAPPNLETRMREFLLHLTQEGAFAATVPLEVLLMATFDDPMFHWLHAQLLAELSVAIEAFLDWDAMSSNPVDGIGQIHGSRWDEQLTDHIVLGCGGSGSERASFPGQHTRSFMALSGARLRGKKAKISVGRCQTSVITRYLAVGKASFCSVKDLAIACDGSRVGGKELLQILLVGRAPSGLWKCMWAPPQVFRRTRIQRGAVKFPGIRSRTSFSEIFALICFFKKHVKVVCSEIFSLWSVNSFPWFVLRIVSRVALWCARARIQCVFVYFRAFFNSQSFSL